VEGENQEDGQRLLQVQDLQKQGEMLCTTTSDTAAVWAKAVQTLPFNTMKFALNAAHDTLPRNANLQLWKKKDKLAALFVGRGRASCMY